MIMESLPNTSCADCYSPGVSFASINNGIYICEECAKIHMTLPRDISYLVELIEPLDQYSSLFMQRGGNARFLGFIRGYNVDDLPIEEKYRTKALYYYRGLLKSEVNCTAPPVAPRREEAKEFEN